MIFDSKRVAHFGEELLHTNKGTTEGASRAGDELRQPVTGLSDKISCLGYETGYGLSGKPDHRKGGKLRWGTL